MSTALPPPQRLSQQQISMFKNQTEVCAASLWKIFKTFANTSNPERQTFPTRQGKAWIKEFASKDRGYCNTIGRIVLRYLWEKQEKENQDIAQRLIPVRQSYEEHLEKLNRRHLKEKKPEKGLRHSSPSISDKSKSDPPLLRQAQKIKKENEEEEKQRALFQLFGKEREVLKEMGMTSFGLPFKYVRGIEGLKLFFKKNLRPIEKILKQAVFLNLISNNEKEEQRKKLFKMSDYRLFKYFLGETAKAAGTRSLKGMYAEYIHRVFQEFIEKNKPDETEASATLKSPRVKKDLLLLTPSDQDSILLAECLTELYVHLNNAHATARKIVKIIKPESEPPQVPEPTPRTTKIAESPGFHLNHNDFSGSKEISQRLQAPEVLELVLQLLTTYQLSLREIEKNFGYLLEIAAKKTEHKFQDIEESFKALKVSFQYQLILCMQILQKKP